MAQIGGFLQLSDRTVWFSERFTPEDFYKVDIEVNHSMQRDLGMLRNTGATGHNEITDYALRVSSLLDNTGSLFTTRTPLAFFFEKFCITATSTGIHLDVSHIGGKANVLADAISRWNFHDAPPAEVALEHCHRMTLRDLWLGRSRVAVFPSHTSLSWPLPT